MLANKRTSVSYRLLAPLLIVSTVITHPVTAAAENPGHLVPRQPPRPPRQEPDVRLRQRALALRPRHLLRVRPARLAVRPARRVQEHDPQLPVRDALVAPDRPVVVYRAPFPADRAVHTASLTFKDRNLQRVRAAVQFASFVDKALVRLKMV